MNPRYQAVDDALRAEVERGSTPAAQLVIRRQGDVVFAQNYGLLDPFDPGQPVRSDTRFDLASVTKLFTTTLFMMKVQAGLSGLDEPVCGVLPEFSGPRPIQPYEDPLAWSETVDVSGGAQGMVDASRITFRQLLSHTSGLPAWRPLHAQPAAASAREAALATFFSYLPGTRVIYSDVGLILLGMAVERLYGSSLADAVQAHICAPLELRQTAFMPIPNPSPENIAPTEICGWRGRRMRGEVHDENAWRLGGAAGHAGLFSNADDLARFGQMFCGGGTPLLEQSTLAEMVKEHASEGAVRRGVGFHLWSPDPEASSHPFSPDTYGHTGFTGTSLWIDPVRELVTALLTNEVYNGRAERKIGRLRLNVMQEIVKAVDGDKNLA